MKLSLIIPCYNEEQNIQKLIKKINSIVPKLEACEIILVNNGSVDKTYNKLIDQTKDHSYFKILNIKKNIGYGNGIYQGIKKSVGDIISWTHADLQTDPADVIDAFSDFQKNPNHKACILKGKRIGRNLFDSFFTFWMGVLCSILMGVRLNDINAQPKMFHRTFLEKMEMEATSSTLRGMSPDFVKLTNMSIAFKNDLSHRISGVIQSLKERIQSIESEVEYNLLTITKKIAFFIIN